MTLYFTFLSSMLAQKNKLQPYDLSAPNLDLCNQIFTKNTFPLQYI